MEIAEKEYKNLSRKMVNNADEGMGYENKQLASGFNN